MPHSSLSEEIYNHFTLERLAILQDSTLSDATGSDDRNKTAAELDPRRRTSLIPRYIKADRCRPSSF